MDRQGGPEEMIPVTIDPRGDICLVVHGVKEQEIDDEEDTDIQHRIEITYCKELLVSSNVMSMASPVFAAMFSSQFSEGQALEKHRSTKKITKVPLPEDNAEAMTLLCRILHLQHDDKLDCHTEAATLKDLARACHKYDCTKVMAVRHAVAAWTGLILLKRPGFQDLCDLLVAAFMFEDIRGFRSLTATISHSTWDIPGVRSKITREVPEAAVPEWMWSKTSLNGCDPS